MTMQLFDATHCELGEGPLWHPTRKQLFWFDIIGQALYWKEDDRTHVAQFDLMCSAAGWVDDQTLLVASEVGLHRFDITSKALEKICDLEADNPVTRSNDGRADPWGGFWIGTMGKSAEPEAGAIYRYYRGSLRRLYGNITISNSICFAPDRSCAYFTDTPTQRIMRQALDPTDGWPVGEPEIWLDLSGTNWRPDGSVTDAAGNLWNAQWGGHRVACYSPAGDFLRAVEVPGAHSSCPAIGGSNGDTLFCTTAMQGISPENRRAHPAHGQTFALHGVAQGWPEPQVIL